MSPHRLILAAALIACGLAPSGIAQCGPDGFTIPGACCAPAFPTLPAFPQVLIPSEGNCFKDCTPGAPFGVTISVTPLFPLFCDVYLANLSITGSVTAGGLMVAKYARTWTESSAAGALRQVWRFLINSDVTYTLSPPISSPCPIPKIATGGLPVHLNGVLEYSFDCGTGVFGASIALVHLCGDFVHASWSPLPIVPNPNPNFVYAFVGPLPFIWGGGPAPAGGFLGDSVRSVNYNLTLSPLLWGCMSEQAELGGSLVNGPPYCPCATPTVPPGPSPWTPQTISFLYGCSTASAMPYTGLALPPLVPTGLSALPLGSWVLPPGIFPGARRLWDYFGFAHSADPCVSGAIPFHIVNGVVTQGPVGIVTPPPPGVSFTSTTFMDLENTLILTGGPPFVAIGYGGLFLASRIWSLNLP